MLYPRIRDLREDNDLTQETLAKILNVKQTTYSKYELGKINIPVESLIKLAAFYKTSVDYLIGVTDDPAAQIGLYPFFRRRERKG